MSDELSAFPGRTGPEARGKLVFATPLLEVRNLSKSHVTGRGIEVRRSKRTTVSALQDVSLEVNANETMGVVGETGAGKSTLARCILGLERPDAGDIIFAGQSVTHEGTKDMRLIRKQLQAVFQDSDGSSNPRSTVEHTIEEPLVLLTDLGRQERKAAVREMMDAVELPEMLAARYRHELSGGQLQRVNLARALVVRPILVVLDEPVSALDASVRGTVISLLRRLQHELGVAYVMISHDLHVVRDMSDRVAIMYDGQVLEIGSTGDIFTRPIHPYTEFLLGSSIAPYSVDDVSIGLAGVQAAPRRGSLWKDDPDWVISHSGGRVHVPGLAEIGDGHRVALRLERGAEKKGTA
jgi:ABC-type glutathione transport system ATPase component